MNMAQSPPQQEFDIDKLCGVSPIKMGATHGAFDASSRTSRELRHFNARIGSVDAEYSRALPVIQARASHIFRNDPFAQNAVALHKNNIVGHSYRLSAEPDIDLLGFDEEWEEKFQTEVEARWANWADNPMKWIDASRKLNHTELLRLGVASYVVNGEMLAAVEWKKPNPSGYQTAIQMIDPSRLCNPEDRAYDLDRVRGGIEFDDYGAPQAYYIRNSAKGGLQDQTGIHKWTRIPATERHGRIKIIHLFDPNYAQQSRGISKLTAVIRQFRSLEKFSDIVLENAIVNASYAAVIESPLDPTLLGQKMGFQQGGNQYEQYTKDMMTTAGDYMANAKNLTLSGVKIPLLPIGTKLSLTPMGNAGGLGTQFDRAVLRKLAAALDVSYEQLSRDFSETNYSSARAAMLETWKAMQSIKATISDAFATHNYCVWFEEAYNNNVFKTLPEGSVDFYNPDVFSALTKCNWIGASRGQIDEKKETEALLLKVNGRLMSRATACGLLGVDWRSEMRQMAREEKYAVKIGLTLPSIDGNTGKDEEEEPEDSEEKANNKGDKKGDKAK